MSMQIPPNSTAEGTEISHRKNRHLTICTTQTDIETGSTRLNEVHLVHQALSEIPLAAVDTSTRFLGRAISMPFFISSMTGGSEAGYKVNKDLAQAAETLGIPIGTGSIRILFTKPQIIEHFQLRKYAPTVPIFANIGSTQLTQYPHGDVYTLLEKLDVSGIAVHLNAGQELFQQHGSHDFTGIVTAIKEFISTCPIPVIIKETGFGIHPKHVDMLLAAGAAYVDIAGGGGTNWIRVEAAASNISMKEIAPEFDDWGIPTALALAALGREKCGILASGGIRTGMDILRSLALGAEAAGLALPFIQKLQSDGIEKTIEFGNHLGYSIRIGMVLCGCKNIAELRSVPMWQSAALEHDAEALRQTLAARKEMQC